MDILNPIGEKIGEVNGNSFEIHRKLNHFMKIFQGFGLSIAVINKLRAEGVTKVITIYHGVETHRYECELRQYIESDKERTDISKGVEDPQKFVSTRDMQEVPIK